jgi:eukaryotic-like serine/threonine-protein kinase
LSNSGDDRPPTPPGLASQHRTETSPRDVASEATVAVSPLSGGPMPSGGNEDFDVGSEIARGGLGRILIGFDKRLQRQVAIKQLIANDGGADARFLREARITARLQHPSIVPIYVVGQLADERPFYAMKLVSGRSLREVIADRPTLRERLALLPNLLAVAEAIAYAHDKRIVHRDIKPANVVLGPFGETLVIDWGLAKDLDEKDLPDEIGGVYRADGRGDVTIPGTIVGTPAFMPPEQARGEPVDARADVYALGAMLYHLLAGGPPYEGVSSAEVLDRVRTAPPPPLAARVRSVPAELAAIVDKAMARAPAARYPDGAAFAADLSRYLSGRLVEAHQYSLAGRAARFVARHKLPFALSTVFVVALAVLGTLAVTRVVREKDRAERERDRAETRSNQMILAGARAALERDPTATLAWLKRYPLDGVDWDQARSLALDAVASGAARHIFQPKEGPGFGAFAPDGKSYALIMDDPDRIELRETVTGRIMRTLPVSFANRLHFSSDGKRLVWRNYRAQPPTINVWQLDKGAPRAFPTGPIGNDDEWEVSADGMRAAVASPAGDVQWIDLADGRIHPVGKLKSEAQQIEITADGRAALAAEQDGTITVWTLDTEPRARSFRTGPGLVGLDVSRDGKLLLAYGKRLEVIELDSGKKTALPGDSEYTGHATFSDDGKLVAAVGPDRIVRVFDWRKGTVEKHEGHSHGVNSVAFDRSGRRLASASRDATVRIWAIGGGRDLTLRGHSSQVVQAEFSADGSHLATASADRSTRIWSLPADFEAAAHVHNGETWDLRFPDATHTLTVSREDDTATIADLTTGEVHNVAELKELTRIVVSPDRTLFATDSGTDPVVAVWRVGEARARLYDVPGGPAAIDFSCDGKSLAVASRSGSLGLLDLASGKLRTLAQHVVTNGWLSWSPSCQRVAARGPADSNTIVIWDVARAQASTLAPHKAVIHRWQFIDDDRLVSYDWGGGLFVTDLTTRKTRSLAGHSAAMMDVAISPDRSLLASADGNGVVRLWSTQTWESRALIGHEGAVYSLEFSADGNWLLSGGQDRMLRLWDVHQGTQLQSIRDGDTIVRAVFAPDRGRVGAGDNEGNVRVFHLGPSAPAERNPAALRKWLLDATTVVERDDHSLASP